MDDLTPVIALVVEDDELQREALSSMLKDQNMDVIECESAEAAELIISRNGAELGVLVTDVKLKGFGNGIELAHYAKRMFPTLNVVVISGTNAALLPPGVHFLQKPFRTDQLMRVVRS